MRCKVKTVAFCWFHWNNWIIHEHVLARMEDHRDAGLQCRKQSVHSAAEGLNPQHMTGHCSCARLVLSGCVGGYVRALSRAFYSLSGPSHPPRPPRWPRSPPFPSRPAGRAAARTAPVCPAARRSSARTPWPAPGPLPPSAAAQAASSPAASLCHTRRARWGPEPWRRGASPRLRVCSPQTPAVQQHLEPQLEQQQQQQLVEAPPAASPAQVVAAELEPLRQTW